MGPSICTQMIVRAADGGDVGYVLHDMNTRVSESIRENGLHQGIKKGAT